MTKVARKHHPNYTGYCKSCQAKIPDYEIHDGKKYRHNCRIYCTSCSPIGSRNNGASLTGELNHAAKTKPRTCVKCNKSYMYNRAKGDRLDLCHSCITRQYRRDFKKKCVEYKGGKCMSCGYDKCIGALHFHHDDPTLKEYSICGSARSFDKVKPELDKCILLCANCHAEYHYNSESVGSYAR